MRVCFIGHRTIEKTKEFISSLEETIIGLIKRGCTIFLFGSKSEFNDLSWEIVTKLKESYPFIKRIYVRSAYQHINKSYEEYLLKSYEETYFPTKLERAGKYSYVERNFEMIDNCSCCVFYYNEKYVPLIKPKTKSNKLVTVKRISGTKVAYEYAKKRKREIINLYNEKETK